MISRKEEDIIEGDEGLEFLSNDERLQILASQQNK